MGIVLSVEQYQTLLIESGLLSRDDVREFLDELPSESRPRDAQGLAKALVKAEKLTKFQATAVYQGQIKELVLGEYEVLDKLGQGGMGIVLLARHRRMERLAAVKVLPKSTMKSPAAIDRFYREAKAAARLSHPNIVTAHDASEKNGTHYLVMEYVDGEDLAQISKQRGPLPVEQAVDCMVQAARGLQYAHDQGVVHRDIKPANLLVDRNGTVKILDMGLARLHSLSDAEPTEQDRLTQSGQVMGTCDYMAPEQAEDTHGADHRADIYALGCSLYRLLTGEAPYKGDTLIKILMAHRDDAIPSLRDKRPDVSEELDSVFGKMVAKDPGNRYQSMSEVIAALEGCHVAAAVGTGSFDPELGVSSEPSADSKLTAFLQGLPEVGVAKPAPRPHGETIQGQAELETGKELPTPRRHKQPAWMLPALIGGGVFIVVLVGGLLMTRSGSVPRNQPEGGQVAQVESPPQSGREQEAVAPPPSTQQEPSETPPPEPQGSAELVERSTEEPTPTDQPEPSDQPPTVAPAPAKPQGVDREAEAARLAVIEAHRAAEMKYRQAIEQVETKVAKWDFLGALQTVESIRFEEPALTARLAARREEIRLMGALKQRITAAINEAKPPLEKSDLMIRGMGGQINSASDAGITATLRNDKAETTAWTDVGDRATSKLLELAIDPTNGKMLLAGALLATAAADREAAEDYFSRAEAQGEDISNCLIPDAAALLVEALNLLEREEYGKTLEELVHIESLYGTIPWYAATRDVLDAAEATAMQGMLDAEAEQLYTRAVGFAETERLFDLRAAVNELKSDFAASRVFSDPARVARIADFEKAVADLGPRIVVRLDGQGDHTSIQSAIDAAPVGSLVEILDEGPYNEELVIPAQKSGLTIRGSERNWPVITSIGEKTNFPVLLDVQANDTVLERLVLSHRGAAGSDMICVNGGPVRNLLIRSVVLFGDKAFALEKNSGEVYDLEQCVVIGSTWRAGFFRIRDSIWVGAPRYFWNQCQFNNSVITEGFGCGANEFDNCTIGGPVTQEGEPARFTNCIVPSVEVAERGTQILFCNVHDKVPYRNDAVAGEGCLSAVPNFLNPKVLDFRLDPTSAGIGKASDGGDIGCRYTPEMLEMAELACELRSRGIVGF